MSEIRKSQPYQSREDVAEARRRMDEAWRDFKDKNLADRVEGTAWYLIGMFVVDFSTEIGDISPMEIYARICAEFAGTLSDDEAHQLYRGVLEHRTLRDIDSDILT